MSDPVANTLAQAIELEQSGKLEEALKVYDQAILNGSNDVLIFSNRGLLLERLQRWEDAFNSFSKAAEIESNFRDHYNAGNMLLVLKRYAEAIAAFDASLACRDDYAESCVNKGIAHYSLEQLDEAGRCFDKALTLDPQFPPALRSSAILKSAQGDEASACAFYKKAAQAQPDRASAWFEYGCALYKTLGEGQVFFEPDGPEGLTLQAFDRVIELQPETQGAWGRKIGVLFRLADAALATDRAASSAGSDAPALFPMLHGELLSCLQEACQRFPDDAWFAERKSDAENM